MLSRSLPALLVCAGLARGQIVPVPGPTLHGAADELFATGVAGAGDVNGDGLADVMVDSLSSADPGHSQVRVYSGDTGAVLFAFGHSLNILGFGKPLSGAGDVNADGFDDVIIGDSGTNSARVYSGADGSLLLTFTGDAPADDFGGAVSAAGDVNVDGVPDLIVGTTGFIPGYARVFSGADGAVLQGFSTSVEGDELGASVASAGDANGDGYADVAIAALGDGNDVLNPGVPPFIPPFWTDDDTGAVTVFSGQDGSKLFTMLGDHAADGFGFSLSGAGDVNRDGYGDIIAGTFSFEDPSLQDYARVISGADGSTLDTFLDDDPTFPSSVRVGGAGDVDHDGFADVIVGSTSFDPAHVDASIFSGADGSVAFAYSAGDVPQKALISVAGVGDANGDGLDDFIVGVGQAIIGQGYAVVFVSQGSAAAARAYGCGVNPEDSLQVIGGPPVIGHTLTIALHDPTGTLGQPAAALLAISHQPDPAYPCGTLLPGWGLAGPGARGELLVGVTPPDPLLVLHIGDWTGAPVPIALTVPNDLELLGLTFYAQGALIDPSHRIGLTAAVALTVGSD